MDRFTNESLPYTIGTIGLPRLARQVTSAWFVGPSIKRRVEIREAITYQREKRLTISYLELKIGYINKTHTQSGSGPLLFQFSLCLLI